jgi:hypothetical protein
MAKKKGRSPQLARAMRVLQDIRFNMKEGETFEDLDPQAFEAVGVVLGIMRGTIKGRHLSTRLNAALAVLYQYRGRPAQRTEHDVGTTLAELIEKSMELEAKGEIPSLPEPKRDLGLTEEPPLDVEVINEKNSHSAAS